MPIIPRVKSVILLYSTVISLALNTRSIADRRTAMSAPAVSARAMARTVSHLATVLRYASSSSIAALTIFDDVCVARSTASSHAFENFCDP